MEKKDRLINDKISDLLLELPQQFEVDGRSFSLYPVTLGKTYLLSPLYEQLDLNPDISNIDPTLEMLRSVQNHKETVCKIIAYHTLNKREDIGDASKVLEIADFLGEHTTLEELTKLLVLAMGQNDLKEMQDYLGITREHKLIEKCNRAKKKGSSLDFCGKSVFGSLIIPACEKLNLTPMQVIWGISYKLLQMLMSDAIVTIYLSEDERKKVHIPNDRSRINADTKEGMEQIMRMNWN